MKYKKIVIIIVIVLLAGTTFGISYYWSLSRYKNTDVNNRKQVNSTNETVSAQGKTDEEIKPNSRIIFITKYTNSDLVKTDKIDTSSDYSGKTTSQLEKVFEKDGYKFSSISRNDVTFLRELEKYKYAPNKYVLGVKDSTIVIYKTDDNSVLQVDEITNIKVDNTDSKRLEIGGPEFQYDTKENALDASSEYR
ncbi:MAG: hypothetical protein K0R54_2817 [Clostridiaceae bacterium]|jgi:hypothetical protein|nr:hypothetical protein [Clostridiaceae bacterium]